jgi:signal transduction histidine kinase
MDSATRSVLDVARGLLGELDLEAVLGRILHSARELTRARYAALGVLDESRTHLGRFLTLGIDEHARRAIGPLPTGHGVLGELIRRPEPLRVADVGAHPRSYGFPAAHPEMQAFLGVPIIVDGLPFGNLYLTEKEGGGEFTERDEEAAVVLAEFAGVAIGYARRHTGAEERRVALEDNVNALEATIEIARALGGRTDLGVILELVAKRGRALVSARALVIELRRDGELEIAAVAGELPAGLVGKRLELEDAVAGAALRSGRTQRLSDRLNRSRYEQHGLGRLGVPAEEALVVPLVFRDAAYGVLVAIDRLEAGPGFTIGDQRVLEAFAASAATAVATARSAAEEHRRQRVAAAEAERSRWARELHDETLQGLASVRVLLAGARRSGTADAMAGAIDQAVAQLQSDINDLRALITDLRPAALDEIGLQAALEALADRVHRTGLEVELDTALADEGGEAPRRLAPDLETAIYRIVQEALTNAARHGRAAHASVTLVDGGTTVEVTIRDDGAGFDPAAGTGGFGLLGMHERVQLLDGTLAVESAPGQGATVRASFPARRARASAEAAA